MFKERQHPPRSQWQAGTHKGRDGKGEKGRERGEKVRRGVDGQRYDECRLKLKAVAEHGSKQKKKCGKVGMSKSGWMGAKVKCNIGDWFADIGCGVEQRRMSLGGRGMLSR
jgi:hypothetical protein